MHFKSIIINLFKEAKSIVAGPSFLQFLNKLFQIQIATGDIIQFESRDNSKYYMLSATGTWMRLLAEIHTFVVYFVLNETQVFHYLLLRLSNTRTL